MVSSHFLNFIRPSAPIHMEARKAVLETREVQTEEHAEMRPVLSEHNLKSESIEEQKHQDVDSEDLDNILDNESERRSEVHEPPKRKESSESDEWVQVKKQPQQVPQTRELKRTKVELDTDHILQNDIP